MTKEMNVFDNRVVITNEERLIKNAQGFDVGFVLDGKKIWFNSEKLKSKGYQDELITKLNDVSHKNVYCIHNPYLLDIGIMADDELVLATYCPMLFLDRKLDYVKVGFDVIRGEKSFHKMFGNCSLRYVDLSEVDTSSIIDFSEMFSHCENLSELDVSSFKIKNDDCNLYFDNMFGYCKSLKKIKLFNLKGKCSLSGMFFGCSSLEELDLSGFDVSGVYNINCMFAGCSRLKRIDFSGWKLDLDGLCIGDLDDMQMAKSTDMFYDCLGLEEVVLIGCNDVTKRFIKGLIKEVKSTAKWNLRYSESQDSSEFVEEVRFVE